MDRPTIGPSRAPTRREFLAGAGALALGAGCASTKDATGGPLDLPLLYDERGQLLVEARVEGGAQKRFILDTGASRSALSAVFVRALGLRLADGGVVEGSAGVVRARAAVASVEVPGLPPQSIDFTVYDFGASDPECVGILGHEFLSRAPFQIRYRDRSLLWGAPPPARTVTMALDGRIPRIQCSIRGQPVELRIDTGASFPPGNDAYVNLTEEQAERLSLDRAPIKVFSATGTGGTVLRLPVHALEGLRIAEVAIPRAFAIVQPRVGYFARPDAVGFLGNAVLDKLDPFLDYAGGVFGVAG